MIILVIISGAIIGSFLNVCIHRLPRGESLLRPRSHCAHCRQILRWQDLIPVLSFLWLRGCCRFCRVSIPVYHLIVEVLTALVWMWLFQIYGLSWLFLTATMICSLLIVIAFIDLHWFCIPNSLVLTGIFLALIQNLIFNDAPVLAPFIGLSAGAMILWLPGQISKTFFHRPSLGAGDVKLAAMLGLFLGWQQVFVVIWLACLAGAVYGMAGMGAGRFTRASKIPLGFFLGLCAIAYIIAKTKIIHFKSWPCL
jgi:leader peptidase (prepilin peptidase)/N-methyltransferase